MSPVAALAATFAKCKQEERPAFVGFITAGYPTPSHTVDLLLGLQAGGVDIIELGIPFTDPLADGPVIQNASQIALEHGTCLADCLRMVKEARLRGLTVPVVFMGYYNPLLSYGVSKLMKECVQVGVHGFIVVDLPPEEADSFIEECRKHALSYVPLISPTSTDERVQRLCKTADTFIYVVSALGVTGHRASVNQALPQMIARLQSFTSLPLAVGFGVSTREHFEQVGTYADGVVIGTQIIRVIEQAEKGKEAEAVTLYAKSVSAGASKQVPKQAGSSVTAKEITAVPGLEQRFGDFGGQYAPETLMFALDQLEKSFMAIKEDPSFWKEFESYYDFIGRPSKLQFAERMTAACGGARIWLKREDLNHTGSHKINNALGQILLAKRLGKTRIIAETGAGQHGVATATVCAHFNLPCTVYMGETDTQRQQLNVFRMTLLGAKVVPVKTGSRTLKDAINEAMRDWVTNVEDTHYLVGSAIGPHPFPTIVRTFQSVIGQEVLRDMKARVQKVPDMAVACVGGGSNAIGLFHPLANVRRKDGELVQLVGVEAGGEGVETGNHSAPLSAGTPGVLHGCRTYLMQDQQGQIMETHSISAGLDYPGVGPEHAWLKDSGRAQYVAATDKQALLGFKEISRLEGIIPALETSHAIYYVMQIAPTLPKDFDIVVSVSGRGDKDVKEVRELFPKYGIDL